jgi:chromate reductase, NAD(P)H dehydrogenase (quinone)
MKEQQPRPTKYRLLGISGSLRLEAFSSAILTALAEKTASQADYDYADIGALPHFNQDLYVDPLPDSVRHFRDQVAVADGLVITSPEFNHGIPGVLKNALDWGSRPHNGSPLRDKPVLIITSSPAFTGGVRAQYQIRETLVSALARPVNTPEIVVGGVGSKVIEGRFEDATVIEFAMNGFATMFEEIERRSSAQVS